MQFSRPHRNHACCGIGKSVTDNFGYRNDLLLLPFISIWVALPLLKSDFTPNPITRNKTPILSRTEKDITSDGHCIYLSRRRKLFHFTSPIPEEEEGRRERRRKLRKERKKVRESREFLLISTSLVVKFITS